MSGKRTTRSKADSAESRRGHSDWDRLAAMTDDEAEQLAATDPDAQPATEEELSAARRLYQPGTEPVLVPMEREVLEWFRRHGGRGDVGARINRALKEYVSSRS